MDRSLITGLVWALAVGCGGSEPGTPNMPDPGATPMGGMPGPLSSQAGSQASAGSGPVGSPAAGTSGAGGTTGMATSGVSTAGALAAAGSSGASGGAGTSATAGAEAGGTNASAGEGGGGSGAAGSNAVAGGAAAAGCGSESFAAIYESILKNTTYNCAGPLCHGREAANAMTVGDLSLSTASVAYMQLVNVSSTGMACSGMPRVTPGDAAGSLLVQKLRSDTTTCGGVMPVGADEITDTDLKRITDWISAGACDN